MIIKAFTKSQGAQEVATRKNNSTISPRASEKARPCLQLDFDFWPSHLSKDKLLFSLLYYHGHRLHRHP